LAEDRRSADAARARSASTEEYDVQTGRHLGNFHQAFSHLVLVEAASRIILAERLQEIYG
jgi:GH15 family glucan-1,4-alpha-glucosidase